MFSFVIYIIFTFYVFCFIGLLPVSILFILRVFFLYLSLLVLLLPPFLFFVFIHFFFFLFFIIPSFFFPLVSVLPESVSCCCFPSFLHLGFSFLVFWGFFKYYASVHHIALTENKHNIVFLGCSAPGPPLLPAMEER